MAVDVLQNDGVALDFVVSPDRPSPPNRVDAEILRRALTYLSEPAHWNRADATDMDAAPRIACLPTVARSLLCQLYIASVDVAGDYAHFRPAINAVRQAIRDASKNRLRHPLVEFNNAASTQLIDLQGVLNAALKRILDQLSNTGTEAAAADDARALSSSVETGGQPARPMRRATGGAQA